MRAIRPRVIMRRVVGTVSGVSGIVAAFLAATTNTNVAAPGDAAPYTHLNAAGHYIAIVCQNNTFQNNTFLTPFRISKSRCCPVPSGSGIRNSRRFLPCCRPHPATRPCLRDRRSKALMRSAHARHGRLRERDFSTAAWANATSSATWKSNMPTQMKSAPFWKAYRKPCWG
jgi:hypothetical protein